MSGIKPSRWTSEQDQQLRELREKKQLKWPQVAELIGNGKSAQACQTRYNRYVKGK